MQERIKILFVLPFPPPVHGASAIASQIRENALINEVFDCEYINLSTSRKREEIGRVGINKFFRFFRILVQIMSKLTKKRYKLIYIAISVKRRGFFRDTLLVFLIKMFNKKLLIHMHGKGISLRQNKYFDDLLYKFVFNNSEVILLSKLLYPDIQKYVPKENVHYCPNGIPNINKRGNGKSSECDGRVQILFLSNLIESKGVNNLLEACKLLQDKQLRFHCTFIGGIGDVSETQFNARVFQLGIGDHVSYDGEKYGDDKVEAFLKADIFAFPTYFDAFPLVNIEAMQFNLPVISTFEGGIPDVIENGMTGFLVPPKNAQALAEKLEILIKDKELRIAFGKAGRLRYEQYFTIQHFENTFTSILKSLVNL